MKQSDSTNVTEEKSKKETRRSRAKNPALQKKFNLKVRQDYIETDYINGVYDKHGNKVIRELNGDELDFLNKFYEEAIGANFQHDTALRKLNKEIRRLKKEDPESEELRELQVRYNQRAEEVLLYPDKEEQKKIYGENNARNRCLYNKSKMMGTLGVLDDEVYNSLHNNVYNNPNTADDILINTIDKTLKREKKKK
jgi:hypothetical protein